MGGEADMVRKMRIGQIQAAALTAVGLAEIDRSVSALQFMPMVFRSPAEIEHVIKKLSPKLEQTFLDKGFVVLGWTLAGWVNYFSKDPVLLPEDLKKMKLFVWAGDSGGVDLVKELGYQPVPLEIADILPGLQTGMIQAFPTIPVYANAGQFFTQATHMIQINWAPVVGGLVMNKKAWDRMPPAVQAEVRAAAMEAGQKISERSRKENEEAVSAMEKRGLKVKVPPPEAVDAWRKLAESVYPKIRGRIVPAPMFDEVMAILKEYRASGSNRGS
jgi:TRAP-type C4-dicarboxylate transport system substrate-binding protein